MTPLIYTFNVFDNFYVFDANANSILKFEKEQWEIVKEIEQGIISEVGQSMICDLQKNNYFVTPNIREIKHPETDVSDYHLNRKIAKLTLQVTQRCNLRCSYCSYSGIYQNRTHEAKTMSYELAKKAIDYVLERTVDEREVNFGFYGGEPLLELDLIDKCMSYIHEKGGSKNLTFTITTNGTLLTPDIYERLVNHDFSIVVSLDGPQGIHDATRKYPDGRGSFDDIMMNLKEINKKYSDARKRISFNAVVSPDAKESCLEELFKMEDILPYYGVNMSFVSDIYIDKSIKYDTEFSAKYTMERAKLLLYMLGRLDKSKVSRLMIQNEERIRMDYRRFRRIEKLPEIIHPGGPCLAGAHRLFINVDGDFFPCERVSETSEVMKIGNIDTGIDVGKANIINNIGKITEEECKNCWAILTCGMCAAHADDLQQLSKEKRLERCEDLRRDVADMLKDICFLKLRGYDFEDKF